MTIPAALWRPLMAKGEARAPAIELARGSGEPEAEEVRSGQVLDTFCRWTHSS